MHLCFRSDDKPAKSSSTSQRGYDTRDYNAQQDATDVTCSHAMPCRVEAHHEQDHSPEAHDKAQVCTDQGDGD